MDIFEQIVWIILYLHGLRQERVDEVQPYLLESVWIIICRLLDLLLISFHHLHQIQSIIMRNWHILLRQSHQHDRLLLLNYFVLLHQMLLPYPRLVWLSQNTNSLLILGRDRVGIEEIINVKLCLICLWLNLLLLSIRYFTIIMKFACKSVRLASIGHLFIEIAVHKIVLLFALLRLSVPTIVGESRRRVQKRILLFCWWRNAKIIFALKIFLGLKGGAAMVALLIFVAPIRILVLFFMDLTYLIDFENLSLVRAGEGVVVGGAGGLVLVRVVQIIVLLNDSVLMEGNAIFFSLFRYPPIHIINYRNLKSIQPTKIEDCMK